LSLQLQEREERLTYYLLEITNMKLDLGDKGPHVLELQSKLGVEATGMFDNTTRIAVIGLQLDNGLAAHGAVNDLEWDLLGCKEPQTKVVYNENAKDGDSDGLVQEGTIFERPANQKDGE
jgi:hypothetical protein